MRRPVPRSLLLAVVAAAVVGFGAYGLATDAGMTVSYVVTVVVLGAVVGRLDRTVRFSDVVALGLTGWAVGHLAGGLIELDGDRVLYNAVLLPHLRYDNVVHFVGFGVGGIAVWEWLSSGLLAGRHSTPLAAGVTAWLFGMGLGALNEVVEFFIALNVEESNVGGYLNTGRDLVANLLGAAVAGVIVGRRCRSTEGSGTPPGRRRRWPLFVGGVGVVVVLVAAAWWFYWVPNWRPPLRPGERYGIDVSAHQAAIDWASVAEDDIDFAYIKATEGGDFVDARFSSNWGEAGRVGLDRGAYHFFTLCTPGEGQAENFLRVAPPSAGALAPAVDLELVGNCKGRPSTGDVDKELSRFLERIEEAWNTKAVLYVGDEFERRYPVREKFGRPLWHRRFLRRPNVANWIIWQLHGYARVAGIEGGVDLDVMRPG